MKISKTAPVRVGTQKPGENLFFNVENRKTRRAEAVKTSPKTLPKSIWLITAVVSGFQLHTSTPLYRLSIERRDAQDTIVVYSKEGQAPVAGGLLERMARPACGEAAIWTDGKASRSSMGGGYTFAAVPKEWGFPEPEPVVERKFENLTLGVAWSGPQ